MMTVMMVICAASTCMNKNYSLGCVDENEY